MIDITVVIKDGYYGLSGEGWVSAVTESAKLINVFWHPVDGVVAAVLMPWDEVVLYDLKDIEIKSQ
jgi:hypothetical protein